MMPSKWINISGLGLVLLLMAGWVLFSADNEESFRRAGEAPENSASQSSALAPQPLPATAKAEPPKSSLLRTMISEEGTRIGQIDRSPQLTKERLRRRAQELDRKDFSQLAELAFDLSLSRDERYFAVYIMSLSEDPEVIPYLTEVANKAMAAAEPTSRHYSEDLILRGQALEGFRNFAGQAVARRRLQDYIDQQNNSFLVRQAQSVLVGL